MRLFNLIQFVAGQRPEIVVIRMDALIILEEGRGVELHSCRDLDGLAAEVLHTVPVTLIQQQLRTDHIVTEQSVHFGLAFSLPYLGERHPPEGGEPYVDLSPPFAEGTDGQHRIGSPAVGLVIRDDKSHLFLGRELNHVSLVEEVIHSGGLHVLELLLNLLGEISRLYGIHILEIESEVVLCSFHMIAMPHSRVHSCPFVCWLPVTGCLNYFVPRILGTYFSPVLSPTAESNCGLLHSRTVYYSIK